MSANQGGIITHRRALRHPRDNSYLSVGTVINSQRFH
jgi:hypothetical protein